jgi:amino acid permease
VNRSHFLENFWYESYMPVYLERFVLPILVALAVGVCVFNPWKWDWNQRISVFLGVACFAYFFAYTSYHSKLQVGTDTSQFPAATTNAPSTNSTNGPQSPVMPNNNGSVTINSDDSKPKKPPQKDKPK